MSQYCNSQRTRGLYENSFYSLSGNNALIDEICQLAKMTQLKVEGRLLQILLHTELRNKFAI